MVRWKTFQLMGALLLAAGYAQAFNEHSLWLPGKYQQQLAPELRQAAMKVEAEERCQTLLRGSLHDSSKSVDDARFLFVCRDPQGTTFPVIVDAQTLEISYRESGSTDGLLASGDSEKAKAARLSQVKTQCKALFEKNTQRMKGMQRLESLDQAIHVAKGGELVMSYAFDALSPTGHPLQYRAVCTAVGSEPATLSMGKRE